MNPLAVLAITAAGIGIALAGAYAITRWAIEGLEDSPEPLYVEWNPDWDLDDELQTLTEGVA